MRSSSTGLPRTRWTLRSSARGKTAADPSPPDRRHRAAGSGRPGGRNNRSGAAGEDLVILVPDGTVVADDRGLVADLVGPEASAVVARGGRGGRGSSSLASARNRVPRVVEAGE